MIFVVHIPLLIRLTMILIIHIMIIIRAVIMTAANNRLFCIISIIIFHVTIGLSDIKTSIVFIIAVTSFLQCYIYIIQQKASFFKLFCCFLYKFQAGIWTKHCLSNHRFRLHRICAVLFHRSMRRIFYHTEL